MPRLQNIYEILNSDYSFIICLDSHRCTIRMGGSPCRWNGTQNLTQKLTILHQPSSWTGFLTRKPALPPFEGPTSRCSKGSWEADDITPEFSRSRGRSDRNFYCACRRERDCINHIYWLFQKQRKQKRLQDVDRDFYASSAFYIYLTFCVQIWQRDDVVATTYWCQLPLWASFVYFTFSAERNP